MSRSGELEVVVPCGFDVRAVPDIVDSKKAWIERAVQRMECERRSRPGALCDPVPRVIKLDAVGEEWLVEHRDGGARRTIVRESAEDRILVVSGSSDKRPRQEALRRWLKRRGRAELCPWLAGVAREGTFGPIRSSIRLQRSRWGSASSSSGTITLNAKLLFLPPILVRHVMLHELCHTLHADHSPRFYAVLAEHDREHLAHRKELRSAWRFVPDWVEA